MFPLWDSWYLHSKRGREKGEEERKSRRGRGDRGGEEERREEGWMVGKEGRREARRKEEERGGKERWRDRENEKGERKEGDANISIKHAHKTDQTRSVHDHVQTEHQKRLNLIPAVPIVPAVPAKPTVPTMPAIPTVPPIPQDQQCQEYQQSKQNQYHILYQQYLQYQHYHRTSSTSRPVQYQISPVEQREEAFGRTDEIKDGMQHVGRQLGGALPGVDPPALLDAHLEGVRHRAQLLRQALQTLPCHTIGLETHTHTHTYKPHTCTYLQTTHSGCTHTYRHTRTHTHVEQTVRMSVFSHTLQSIRIDSPHKKL